MIAVPIGTRIVVGLLAWAMAALAFAVTWEVQKDGLRPVPPLTSPVTDLTGTLSASELQALAAKLRNWEAQTTNQLVVLMVPTTAPETIEDYSIRLADAWKIGQKGKDNGAILLVAKDDKRVRIEVGYGFEGVLTDVTSRRIIGETIAPYFKQGQFAAGINAGVDRIMSVVDKGEPLPPPGNAERRTAPQHGNLDFGTLLVILLVAVPVIGSVLRSMFGTLGGSVVGAGIAGAAAWFIAASLLIAGAAGVIAFVVILFSSLGGRGGFVPMGGGGFRGGGFGGGGFGGGGFSGGGGGFGGGGASGGWD